LNKLEKELSLRGSHTSSNGPDYSFEIKINIKNKLANTAHTKLGAIITITSICKEVTSQALWQMVNNKQKI
jgi:hypothetical protein